MIIKSDNEIVDPLISKKKINKLIKRKLIVVRIDK